MGEFGAQLLLFYRPEGRAHRVLADNVLWRLMKLAARRKIVSRLSLRSTSRPKEGLLSMSTVSCWAAAPPGPERRACGGASIAKGDADPKDEDDGQQANQ